MIFALKMLFEEIILQWCSNKIFKLMCKFTVFSITEFRLILRKMSKMNNVIRTTSDAQPHKFLGIFLLQLCSHTLPYLNVKHIWWHWGFFLFLTVSVMRLCVQVSPVSTAEERHLPWSSPLSFCWSCISGSLHCTGWGKVINSGFRPNDSESTGDLPCDSWNLTDNNSIWFFLIFTHRYGQKL